MALSTTINYDTEANFTHDSTKTEFVGSLVRLKDQRPANATFGHSFNGTLNASWGDGSLTHTVVGATPTVVSNRMVAESSDVRAVKFSSSSNFNSTQVGAFDIVYRPNYSGSPASNAFIIDIANGSNENNRVRMYHGSSGNLIFTVFSSTGSTIAEVSAAWSPSSGVEYNIQGNWDVTSGATRLFISTAGAAAVQHGTTQTGTGTRTLTGLTNIWVGVAYTETQDSNFRIGNIILYDAVQNTAAGFTPVSAISDTIYPIDNPTVLVNSGFATDAILNFTPTVTLPGGSDAVKYILRINSQDYYWNGSAWAISDGTYAQSNTAAEIATNGSHSSFPQGTLQLKAFLHSDNGSTQVSLTSVAIEYSFFQAASALATCTIFGYYKDISGNPIEGATVTFELVKSAGTYSEASDTIIEKSVSVTTSSIGYFDVDLIRSSEFEATRQYRMTITKESDDLSTSKIDSSTKLDITVPDAVSQDITGLLTSV